MSDNEASDSRYPVSDLRKDLQKAYDQSAYPDTAPALVQNIQPKKTFSMSRDDSVFWISLAAFGGGLTAMAFSTLLGIVLILIGIAGLVWANRGHMPKPPLRFAILILALMITAGLSGYDLYDRHFGTSSQPPVRIIATNSLLADGRLSTKLDLRENKADRKIMIVALHYYGTIDGLDQTGLQKSALFDYRSGPQEIIIQPDAKFIREAPNYSVIFFLIDMPSLISEMPFSTLRQAEKLGAIVNYMGANGCRPQLQ